MVTEIRKIKEEDISAVNNLRLSVIRSDPKSFSITFEEARLMQKSNTPLINFLNRNDGVMLGCWSCQKLLGMVGAEVCSGKLTKHRARLFGLYVESADRRKGMGRNLVNEVLKYVKSWPGIEKVVLETTGESYAALTLYRTMGFVETKVEQNAFKHGKTAVSEVHMEMLLSATLQRYHPQ